MAYTRTENRLVLAGITTNRTLVAPVQVVLYRFVLVIEKFDIV